MFQSIWDLIRPYTTDDAYADVAKANAAKQGQIVSTVTPATGTVNSSLPWYITATLVVVGGVLLYKYGSKLLKV